jgi:hypothetical protein
MRGDSIHLVGRASRGGLLFLLACAALLLASGSTSAAALSFCAFGNGPGQCDEPLGVAVDRSNGHVYVVDVGNDRINVFDESGGFLSSFGTPGSGAGELTSPQRVAVDDNPSSPNFHDVYVTDSTPRVQRFSQAGVFEATIGAGQLKASRDQIAVGPGDNLYAFDSATPDSQVVQVKIFTPAGALVGSSGMGVSISAATVDSSGDIYVISEATVKKYELTEPNATLLESFAAPNATALAMGPEGNIFVTQGFGSRVITKQAPDGAILKRFGYGQIDFNLKSLAVGAGGNLFGSEENAGGPSFGNKVIRIEQPPPGPLACCLSAAPSNTKAALKAQVNPEGKSTTYHFDYVTEADYATNGFSGAASSPESAPVGADFEPQPAEALVGCVKPETPPQVSCLKPETAYRYRFIATNADGKSEVEGTFTTLSPLAIEETFATDVGTDAASLHATVNPFGIPATGQFEYVTDAAYQADLALGGGHDGFAEATKVPDTDAGQGQINLGEGEGGKEVSRQVSSLVPATLYHYRFTASDPFVTLSGPEHVFTTFPIPTPPTHPCPNQEFRTAASAALPDCRAYEMVSPVEKNGNDISVLEADELYYARLDQGSVDGNRFTYSSSTAFGDAQSAPWSSQYLATRKAGEGWSTRSLNAPRESVSLSTQFTFKLDLLHKIFDPELNNGWFLHIAEPQLDSCAPPGYPNLYRQNNSTGEYEALITAEPFFSPFPGYRLEVQNVSADGTHAVFAAGAKLTEDAANNKNGLVFQLYEHVAGAGCGELHLVSYLPNGKANPSGPATAGNYAQPGTNRGRIMARALSSDGTRVFFSTLPGGDQRLYVRVNADEEPSPVVGGKCTDPSLGCTLPLAAESGVNARFWTATTDGSKAIYSITGTGDTSRLYEFDTAKALAGEPASTLIAENFRGVAAATGDLSRLYFVSSKALGGEGQEGKSNLYLMDGAAVRFVATLGDIHNLRPTLGFEVGSPNPISNGVRMTPDGSHLAFVTTSSPTGYDNADAADGRPNLEVHLYDAEDDKVACISCNPSGARPRGRLFELGTQSARLSAIMPGGANDLFTPRALSTDGNRLFFESFQALLPRDTNGKADVYEWQRASGGEACEEAGAELFVPSAGGCLSLISTGQSPVDSELADISPDGRDVFIRTQSSLLPQDSGLIDIYDARSNGGLPQPPAPPAACEGEACQGPLTPPNDPTPASSAFEGAGNVKEAPASCRKPKVPRKGRCVAAKKVRKTGKAHKSPSARGKQKHKAG